MGIVTAAYQSNQASKAAKKQAQAYGAAMDEVRRGREAAIGYQNPYMDVGEQALSSLSGLVLGKQYDAESGDFTELSPERRMELFQSSPGYQARLDSAQRALEASQAARGMLFSGRAGVEAMRKAQDIATDEYSNYLGQLGALVGSGQQGATVAANVQTGSASQLAGLNIGQGMARASKNIQNANIAGQLGADTTRIATAAFTGGGF